MENCIFCRIAKGEVPCAKVYEDDNYLAFLDINPSMKAQTLVIPKKHFEDYAFSMSDADYCGFLKTAKKVAKKIDKALKPKRTCLVIEGFDVKHVHIKLFPVIEGYLKLFPTSKASDEELKTLAEKINGA